MWEILKQHGTEPAPERDRQTWAAFLRGPAHAILACDFFTRDSKFTRAFDAVFEAEDIEIVTTACTFPAQTRSWNAETCRHELLDRTLIWNQVHLLHALGEFEAF